MGSTFKGMKFTWSFLTFSYFIWVLHEKNIVLYNFKIKTFATKPPEVKGETDSFPKIGRVILKRGKGGGTITFKQYLL